MFTTYYYPKNKEQLIDCVKKMFEEFKNEVPDDSFDSSIYYDDYFIRVKYKYADGFGGIYFSEGDNNYLNEILSYDDDGEMGNYWKEKFLAEIDDICEGLLDSIEEDIE